LVTETKSLPKKTPETPGTPNRRSASGEARASSMLLNSAVPLPRTMRPGRNLSVAGFGVASVWMNMICLSGRIRSFVINDLGPVGGNIKPDRQDGVRRAP
jgi:hypothetical protein